MAGNATRLRDLAAGAKRARARTSSARTSSARTSSARIHEARSSYARVHYARMHDPSEPTSAAGCDRAADRAWANAIGRARGLRAVGDVARREARLSHVQAVYGSRFS
jgi:hypothetical protein